MNNYIWLVLWNMNGFWLSIQLGIGKIPTDELIFFQRGRYTTNQQWLIVINIDYNPWMVIYNQFLGGE